ncbi:MAG: hypothetical protein IT392_02130 [Nitrospirae bacterium]|nr:hypothetical protein [Nitrospirota bacterium]
MIKNIFNPGNYPKNINFVLLLLRFIASYEGRDGLEDTNMAIKEAEREE